MDLFVLKCNNTNPEHGCDVTIDRINEIYNMINATSPLMNDGDDSAANLWFAVGDTWQETIRVPYDEANCNMAEGDNSIP